MLVNNVTVQNKLELHSVLLTIMVKLCMQTHHRQQ